MIPPLILRLIDHAGLYWTVEVLDGSGALVNDADTVERETAMAFAAWLSSATPCDVKSERAPEFISFNVRFQ